MDKALSPWRDFFSFFSLFCTRISETCTKKRAWYSDEYSDWQKRQLVSVHTAISSVFPKIENFLVSYKPFSVKYVEDKTTYDFFDLPETEQNTILMLGDLAWRLAIANPVRKNPLEGHAIVLIHELYSHMTFEKLLHIFPHVQFIISRL